MVRIKKRRSVPVLSFASPAVPEATLVQPWSTRPDETTAVATARWGGRPCLMTPASVEKVMVDATGEWLPLLAKLHDDRRMPWKKFDLPATTTSSETGPARDDLGLKLFIPGERTQMVRIALEGGLPRKLIDTVEDVEASEWMTAPPSLWQAAADAADTMYDQHIELVNQLYDSVDGDPDMFWDGPAGGIAAWPLEAVLEAWTTTAAGNDPRPAFIVKLARSLSTLLTDVCLSPRKQLKRQRRYQTAGRVQEIDPTCLRWLAKQPGYTMAEKAGSKQQALGVDRVEHADTMENQIVRDLVFQARKAAARYLAENDNAPDHSRVKDVRDFKRVLDQLWTRSPIAKVSKLKGAAQPNYVLQRDSRYRPLWKSYVMLQKQDIHRQKAWRWRHRIWSETCNLALLAAMGKIKPQGSAMRSNVLIRPEQHAGRYIDKRTAIGRWEIRNNSDAISDTQSNAHSDINSNTGHDIEHGRRVHFVEQHQFEDYRSAAHFPEQLCHLCPDAAFVCHDGERPDKPPRKILAIWTVFDFDLDDDHLNTRCQQIDQRLRMIRSDSEMQGIVLQPKLVRDAGEKKMDICHAMNVSGYRLALPLQSHINALQSILREALELNL